MYFPGLNMNDKNDFLTDEDRMIHKLTLHKRLINWILSILKKENISSNRTTGNDSKGDIIFYDEKDTAKVKKIVDDLNKKYNSK